MRYHLVSLVFLASATPVLADDWPQWLGVRRDGATKEIVKPWKEPLKTLWKTQVGEGHGGPVVSHGKAYLFYRPSGKNEETLSAFDAVTGSLLWSNSYPRRETKIPFGNGPRSAPCVVAGKVYTFGITSILTCFDAETGKIDWQVDAEKEYKAPQLFFGSSCSPIVVGDQVIVSVGAKGASIVAFDKNTGKITWKSLDDTASYSSPFLYDDGKQCVVFLTAKGLACLAPKNGYVYWQYPFADLLLESSCTPMMIDGRILASSITAGSVLVDPSLPKIKDAKPAKVWSNSLNCYFSTPVGIGPDTLYMVTGDLIGKKAVLRAVDAKTGKELWNKKDVGTYHATLLRTGDNKLLLVEEKGDLVLIDPNRTGYRELSRTHICSNTWAHPAIANGRLYIRDAKELICVDLSDSPTTPEVVQPIAKTPPTPEIQYRSGLIQRLTQRLRQPFQRLP